MAAISFPLRSLPRVTFKCLNLSMIPCSAQPGLTTMCHMNHRCYIYLFLKYSKPLIFGTCLGSNFGFSNNYAIIICSFGAWFWVQRSKFVDNPLLSSAWSHNCVLYDTEMSHHLGISYYVNFLGRLGSNGF